MITFSTLGAEALASTLRADIERAFGSPYGPLGERVASAARLALLCIANSDALYHDAEHTMQVTLAMRAILFGRCLLVETSAEDCAHMLVASLMHDIGYVRGILPGDDDAGLVVDDTGRQICLPRGSSDAALQSYHVERSKLFVLDRIGASKFLDAPRIARAIAATQFPPCDLPENEVLDEEASLLRAADLIGQLGDPHYLQKVKALYHEFQEAGTNETFGYTSPADLIDLYPRFYWNVVSPRIQTAIRYLNVTAEGRQWLANLYSNVFRAERNVSLEGLPGLPRAVGRS